MLRLILVCLATFFSVISIAQFPSLPSDLSNIKAGDVSEEQVNQVAGYLLQNNISNQQAYDMLITKGMSPVEALALRARIEELTNSQSPALGSLPTPAAAESRYSNQRRYTDSAVKTVKVDNPKRIFGLEIFNNGVLSFEPNLNIATPVGYIIGPGDEININIYGYQEAKYNLKVGPEGDINVPYVGVMYVAGLSIEQASEKIKNKLSASGYSNIRTGLTKVAVTVGRIRSIKVTVLGEVVNPGTYTLPSLATAFNALYLSGGPNDIGSMRKIEIIRNGRVIDVLDIYDFLVKGVQKGNINLRDQDVIRIPAYDVRVGLEGQVKRTGLFEIREGESLADLLNFAGGFSDSAYTASITAYKATDKDRRIIDIPRTQFATYQPGRSESFVVKQLVGRFRNRVRIEGAVYLPGDYELTEGMTLQNLIQKAQGLRENAFVNRGLITRLQDDLTPEYISFSPIDVMQGNTQIVLKPEDNVLINSIGQLREQTTVTITGEVRNGGVFPFYENMSLKDLILLAGGFTNAAFPHKIELGRRIITDSITLESRQVSEVIEISTVEDINVRGADINLQSFDNVVVRRNPIYQQQAHVRVEGEVLFPGQYILQSKDDKISDILYRAGGLTQHAYKIGGYVTRINRRSVISQLNSDKINKIQQTLRDTTETVRQEVDRTFDQIAVDINSILKSPGNRYDLVLQEGDVITIPKKKMDVRISGQVLFPTRVVYEEELNIKDYLGRAGGTTDNARKGKIYVLYPNGNAAKTGRFLFFRNYPEVMPGSEVIVPKKHEVEKRRLTTGEIVGITTALTSFAGVLLSVLFNLR